MKTAIHINTTLWEMIMERLKEEGWIVVYEYDNYDKGIDSDLIIFQKESERLFFGWDNWFEGEIYGSEDRLSEIERAFNADFSYGPSEGILRDEIIQRYSTLLDKKDH